jgi:class 3 adenylate cyclase
MEPMLDPLNAPARRDRDALLIGLAFAALAHAGQTAFFAVLGVTEMALYNVASTAFFSVLWWAVRSRESLAGWQVVSTLLLVGAEVLLFVVLATFYVGTAAGYHFYLFNLLVIPVVVPIFQRTGSTVLLVLTVTALFAGVLWFGALREPVYELAALVAQVVHYVSVSAGVGILVVMGLFVRRRNEQLEADVRTEFDRAESLLLNVLPASIASRLKTEPGPIADRYEDVSILFADLVGFTPLSADQSPDETVGLLNEIFSAFDAVCERHSVEKIRTIGDGYMVIAGAPEPRDDHAVVLTRVALELMKLMASRTEGLQIRIGLSSGPAVAGIVGTSKFHYDVWSDAVNVAARMESHGEPGRFQVSAATAAQLGDAFELEPRGSIAVKGKGEMETFFVLGTR